MWCERWGDPKVSIHTASHVSRVASFVGLGLGFRVKAGYAVQVLDRRPTGKVKRGYVIITATVKWQSTVCVMWSTWYSCILLYFFHPWMAAGCGRGGGVNKASSVWRVEAACPLKRVQRPMTLSLPTPSRLSHVATRLIVSVDQTLCLIIGQSTRLMLVCMGLTFARFFAIIILWRCKIYFAFIDACKWTNTVCWLCI